MDAVEASVVEIRLAENTAWVAWHAALACIPLGTKPVASIIKRKKNEMFRNIDEKVSKMNR